MKRQEKTPSTRDVLEYHGNTTVQRTRLVENAVVWRDWILFDTVREAQEFYHDHR